MGLGTYVREMFTPDRAIDNKEEFWSRYKETALKHALKRDEIKTQIDSKSEEEKVAFKNNLESRLSEFTQDRWQQIGELYKENKSSLSTAGRYASFGASILGGITAAGSILAFAAGGPISLIAGIGYGLGLLTAGAIGNTLADAQDSYDLGRTISEIERDQKPHLVKEEEQEEEGGNIFSRSWKYLKKTASGAWETVKSYFTGTYENSKNAVKYGAIPVAEGVLINSAYSIPGYLAIGAAGNILGAATPITQAAAMGTSALAFYRGRKKFEDKLRDYIITKSIDDLLAVDAGKDITPLVKADFEKRVVQPLERVYGTDTIYAAMTHDRSKDLSTIVPRAA